MSQFHRIASMFLVLCLLCGIMAVSCCAQEADESLRSWDEVRAELITWSEIIDAAVSLTGLEPNAATYHESMAVSNSMNAKQLTGYLDEMLNHQLPGLLSTIRSAEVRLAKLKETNDLALQSFRDSDINQFYQIANEVRKLSSDLSYYRERIAQAADSIYTYKHVPYDESYTLSQRAYYSMKLRDCYELLSNTMSEAVSLAPIWEDTYNQSAVQLGLKPPYDDLKPFPACANMLEKLDELTGTNTIREIELDADAMNVNESATRMSRLTRGTVHGAQAEKQRAHVLVIGDNSIGFRVHDEQGNPVQDAVVSVTDVDNTSSTLSATTDEYGNVAFKCDSLSPDELDYMELSITVKKNGQIIQEVPYALMKKGSIYGGFTQEAAGELMTLTSISFDRFDILVSNTDVYYSPKNDAQQTLVLGIKSTQPYSFEVQYTGINGDTVTACEYDRSATPMDGEKITVKYSFLNSIKPGGALTVTLTGANGTKKQYQTKLNVLSGIVEEPLSDLSGNFLKGMRTELFSYTLPSSLPGFLAGSRISLDIKSIAEKFHFQPSFGVSQDGMFYLAVGVPPSTLGFDKALDKTAWKNSNAKMFDRANEQIESKANGLTTRDKVGAKWEAMEAVNGKFLMGCSVKMSFFGVYQGKKAQTDVSKEVQGQLFFGANFMFNASVSIRYYIGYLSFSFDSSFSIAAILNANMCLVDGADSFQPLYVKFTSADIKLLLNWNNKLTITLGAGIPGLCDVSINAYGYINLYAAIQRDSYLTISAGAAAMVKAQVFFVTWTSMIWQLKPEAVLYDTRNDKLEQYTADTPVENTTIPLTLLSNEEDNRSLQVCIEGNSEGDYQSRDMLNTNVIFKTLKDQTYAFYIDEDYHFRYLCLNKNGEHYDNSIDDWLVSSGGPRNPNRYAYAFDVQEYSNHRDVGVIISLLATDRLETETITLEDGTTEQVTRPGKTGETTLTIFFANAKEGSTSLYNPRVDDSNNISYFTYTIDPCDSIAMNIASLGGDYEELVVSLTLRSMLDNKYYYCHNPFYMFDPWGDSMPYGYNKVGVSYSGKMIPFKESANQHPRSFVQLGDCQWISGYFDEDQIGWHLSYFSMLEYEDYTTLIHCNGQDKKTQRSGRRGEYSIDMGNIAGYQLLKYDPVPQRCYDSPFYQIEQLFYLVEDEAIPNEFHLHGATVVDVSTSEDSSDGMPKKYTYRINHTDYDVALPVADFHIQQNDGFAILYWEESVTGETSKHGDNRSVLRGMYYDYEKDVMSNAFTIADVSVQAAGKELLRTYFGNNGDCYGLVVDKIDKYLTGKVWIYPFKIDLIPSMEFTGFEMLDSMVRAGEYGQMIFSLENTGNIGISAVKGDVVLVDKRSNNDPSVGDVLQEFSISMVKPEDSYTVIKSTASPFTIEQQPYRVEGFRDETNGSHWSISRYLIDCATDGYPQTLPSPVPPESRVSSFTESTLMMQKDVNVYQAPLYIGTDWDGNYDIQMNITDYWTLSNWNESLRQRDNKGNILTEPVPEDSVFEHYHLDDASGNVYVRSESYEQVYGEHGTINTSESGFALNAALDWRLASDKISFPSVVLDTDKENIRLTHRQYELAGEPMVEIHISNSAGAAADRRTPTLRVYADGDRDREIYRYNLAEQVLSDNPHTYIIPLEWLKNGHDPDSLLVEVYRDESKEEGNVSNSFSLYLKDTPMTFVRQPQDMSVFPGKPADFCVEVSGGRAPYQYKWQYMSKKGAWKNIDRETESILHIEAVSEDLNGVQLRCLVQDRAYNVLESNVATLKIKSIPETGDVNRPMLWAGLCVLSFAALFFIVRTRKNRDR